MLAIDQKTNYAPLAQTYAEHRKPHPLVYARLTAELKKSDRILELGCGTGNFITQISEQVGCNCVGIDPSAEMLAQLAARGSSVRTQRGPAERLELADASFDFVYSVDVLHHIRDRVAAFSEAARVLRPGGRICTATDSEEQIRQREVLNRYFPEALEVELARYPRLELVKYEMLRAGLDVASEEVVELPSTVTDAAPYRNKAYSYLLYLSDEAFARGLAELEADLSRAPIPYVSRYVMLWGCRPA